MNIINILNGLDKIYTNHELVCKVLRSLPKEWEAKVTTIQEAKDLTKLSLKELIGSLMTHELSMTQKEEKNEPKRKIVALKSLIIEESSSVSIENSEDDKKMMVIIKRFMRFMRKKKNFEPQREKEEKSQHRKYKKDYPLLKKSSKKLRRKAILANGSSSGSSNWEEESYSSEEEINICLMAHNEELNSIQANDFIFDELFDVFNDLIDEFKKVGLKNKKT